MGEPLAFAQGKLRCRRSIAPPGLDRIHRLPTACAVGFTLAPLRGWGSGEPSAQLAPGYRVVLALGWCSSDPHVPVITNRCGWFRPRDRNGGRGSKEEENARGRVRRSKCRWLESACLFSLVPGELGVVVRG